MAVYRKKGKLRKRLLLDGFSGRIGKSIVVKPYKDKIVVAEHAGQRRKKTTPAQKENQRQFKNAVAYAKAIVNDPKEYAAYRRKLKGRRTVYHAALAEYLMGKRV